jgi:hypothetical protein
MIVIGCTLVILLIVLHICPLETAYANPFWPHPDRYEIIWPSDVTPAKQLNLRCRNSSGQTVYENTINCTGSYCTDSLCGFQDPCFEAFYQFNDQVTDCDLNFIILGTDYVVHYVRPMPVRCRHWETVENESVHIGNTQCSWHFDLSDTKIWNGAIVTGLPPTEAPAGATIGMSEANSKVPATTSAVIESEKGQTFSGIQQGWLRFLIALLLAWLVEIPILLIMARVLFRQRAFSPRRVILLGLLMTLVTLPILWFVLPSLLSPNLYVVGGEALVVLAEAAILKFGLKIDFARALLMSLAANVASYVAGLLLLRI